MKYEDVLLEWIKEKRLEIRNSTYKSYMYTVKNRVIPILGDYEVRSITKKMIQEYIYKQSETLMRETVLGITKVLSQSFNYALTNNYVEQSPWRNIKIPADKEIKEIKVFSPADVEKILSAKNYTKQKKNIVNLAYRTGMRIGEILPLKWEDINFEQKFLMVRRTLSGYDNGIPEICLPKTKSSRRRVDLDDICIAILKNTINTGEYIFCRKNGKVLSRQCVTTSFRGMCIATNVPYRSFHSLRHTHASVLLAASVHPKIVQERLGHAKITTTLDTYSHLIPGIQEKAVEVFNKIL